MKHLIAQATVKAVQNNTDAINDTMGRTMGSIVQNFGEAQSAAAEILFSLIVIEVSVYLLYAMSGQRGDEFMRNMVQKLLLIMTVTFLTLNWGYMAGAIRGYVAGAGGSAGGSGSSISQGLNPAAIADSGVKKVSIIFDANGRERIVNAFVGNSSTEVEPPDNPHSAYNAQKSEQIEMAKARLDQVKKVKASNASITKKASEMARGAMKAAQDIKDKGQSAIKAVDAVSQGLMTNAIIDKFGDAVEAQALRMVALLLFAILAILVIFVHFYVALQVFIISVEFYIVTSITVCFVPFAMNKHTSYLATGAINSVIASSVKLGVLVMILSLMGDPINQMTLSNTPDLNELLSLLFNTATMAFLVSRAPAIAAATFTGGGAGIDISSTVSSAMSKVATPAASVAKAGTTQLGKMSMKAGQEVANKKAARAASKGYQPKAGKKTFETPKSMAAARSVRKQQAINKRNAKQTPYQQKLSAAKEARQQADQRSAGKRAMSNDAKARHNANRVPLKSRVQMNAIDLSKKAQKLPGVEGFKAIDANNPPKPQGPKQPPKMGTFNPHHNTESAPTQKLGKVTARSAQSFQAVGPHRFSVRHNLAQRQNHPVVKGIEVPKQTATKPSGE